MTIFLKFSYLLFVDVFFSSSVGASNKRCQKVCGHFEEIKDAREKILHHTGGKMKSKSGSWEKYSSAEDPANMRIIHGYEPPLRGFMVKIKIYDLATDAESNCGGSIINNQYVLTAGHCVCQSEEIDTVVPCTEDGTMKYDYKKAIKLYLGLLPHDDALVEAKYGSKREYSISKVKIHPQWKNGMTNEDGGIGVDIALLKLEKKIKFSQLIQPICLPIGKLHYPVENEEAYVAGWGKTEKGRRNCFTDNRGPERNQICRFPFKYFNSDMEQYDCVRHTHPSTVNKKCKQFAEQNPDFDWTDVAFIEILYNRKQKSTRCFTQSLVKEYGWCGVCTTGAKPGEEGFCPMHMQGNDANQRGDHEEVSDDELEAEITSVYPGKKWGYCSPECRYVQEHYGEEKTNLLKETQITILTKEQCEVLNKDTDNGYISGTELCGGMKNNFPKYQVWNRNFVRYEGKEKIYKFELEGEKENRLDVPEDQRDLGFYLGWSDSCQGDSGSPLYQFVGKKQKVYQTGVTSRGGECAGRNSPGIYVSLTQKSTLKWIERHSRSGGC